MVSTVDNADDAGRRVAAAEEIRALPKVALHDHLDGGLRASTVMELAGEIGHELPAGTPEALADWFFEAADSGSLVRYLTTFEHTIAIMQSADHLRRVAREFVEDQATDNVVYAEARWAPQQHTRDGLSMDDAVVAVGDGLAEGMDACARAGHPIVVRQILASMRQLPPSTAVAELAVLHQDDLVRGFDLAGPEAGFPPSRFADAFEYLRERSVPVTVHAGEAWGAASIAQAVDCGARRLGHGVRLVEDIADDGTLGSVAAVVKDRHIALEVCPTSNLQTGVAPDVARHPFGRLAALGFEVTVSCDNRLMSRTTLSRELGLLADAFGYTRDDLLAFQRTAAAHAFCSDDERQALLDRLA